MDQANIYEVYQLYYGVINARIDLGFYSLRWDVRALTEFAVTANQNKDLIALFSDVIAGPARRPYSNRHQTSFGFFGWRYAQGIPANV